MASKSDMMRKAVQARKGGKAERPDAIYDAATKGKNPFAWLRGDQARMREGTDRLEGKRK